jgi:hypothetical protein
MVAASLAATPAVASAEIRFASPTGASSGTCTAAEPACSLQRAVETVAQPGDQVVVLAGDYTEGGNAVTINSAIDVGGVPGQPRPRILSTANSAVEVTAAGALVHDLRIDHSGGTGGVALDIEAASTADRAIATSSANIACLPAFGAVIRDSVCLSTAADEAAVRFIYSGAFGPTAPTSTATLRNVTAVAPSGNSHGIEMQTQDVGVLTLNAVNVIAIGSGTGADVAAFNGGTSVTINLDHSNYDSEDEPGPATAITDPGSGANQLPPPQFADPASGEFHQAVGSPTINAGTDDGQLGPLDIDAGSRLVGPAPDIGADEFVPASTPAPPGDTFPPDTGIRKGPKKKTFKRHFKFEFGGSEPGVTFECQLDEGGWEPCTSPTEVKGLKRGKHVYAVRAIDRAGNPDPTPADRRWKVIRRPKKLRN